MDHSNATLIETLYDGTTPLSEVSAHNFVEMLKTQNVMYISLAAFGFLHHNPHLRMSDVYKIALISQEGIQSPLHFHPKELDFDINSVLSWTSNKDVNDELCYHLHIDTEIPHGSTEEVMEKLSKTGFLIDTNSNKDRVYTLPLDPNMNPEEITMQLKLQYSLSCFHIKRTENEE